MTDKPKTDEAPPEEEAPPVEADDLRIGRELVLARASLPARIAHVTAATARLPKTRQAPQQSGGYWFTPVEDMAAAITRLLGAVQVAMLPERIDVLSYGKDPDGDGRRHYWTLLVSWVLTDGLTELRIQSVGEAADWGDKGANKAQTAARKYAYVTAFHLQTGEDTDAAAPPADAEHPKPRQERPASAPQSARTGSGSSGRATASDVSPEGLQARWQAVVDASDGNVEEAKVFLKTHGIKAKSGLGFNSLWRKVAEALDLPAETGEGVQ